ncbi:MAG: hypothetical protein ACKE51_08250 [Methylococcaceae bacterium]
MKKSILLAAFVSLLSVVSSNAIAAGGHSGHGSSVNKSGKGACKKIIINHIKPKQLDVVSPQSKVSFWVNGLKEYEIKHVEATAKKIPIKLSSEVRIGFILFTGNLPESLHGQAARVEIKVHAKRCPVQKGFLLKISE